MITAGVVPVNFEFPPAMDNHGSPEVVALIFMGLPLLVTVSACAVGSFRPNW